MSIRNWFQGIPGFPGFRLKPPSNLVTHARRELELIGEEPDVIAGYLKVIRAFADMGHSGGSAMVAIPTINQLLQFENLSPLTDAPEDWIEVGYGMWQNRRCSRMFSEDGGKTYTDVDDREKIVHTSLVSSESGTG